MPNNASPFAPTKKRKKKQPIATIRMTIKKDTKVPEIDDNVMRSSVDSGKYLGCISMSDAGLLNTDPQSLLVDTLPSCVESARAATAPTNVTRVPHVTGTSMPPRPETTPHFRLPSPPPLLSSSTVEKRHYGMYEINGEIDADATLVDVDGILQENWEVPLRDVLPDSPSPINMPPLDALSKRQLKLIGVTYNPTPPLPAPSEAASSTLFDLNQCSVASPLITPADGMTPVHLLDLAGDIGDQMVVNRAKLMLLQHGSSSHSSEVEVKPSTAPVLKSRHLLSASPVDGCQSSAREADRAATVQPLVRHRLKSGKLGTGSTSTVPCRSVSRNREGDLDEPFTITSVRVTRISKNSMAKPMGPIIGNTSPAASPSRYLPSSSPPRHPLAKDTSTSRSSIFDNNHRFSSLSSLQN